MSSQTIPVVAGVFHRWNDQLQEPEVLLFQRAAGDIGGGHWEFPGGKVELGESDSQALKREMEEEISIKVQVKEKLGQSQFQSGMGRTFELRVYFVSGPVEQIHLLEHQAMKWVCASTVVEGELSIGDRPLMKECFERLKRDFSK